MDLPHASYLCLVQIPVSVIISCKTSNSWTVENTVRMVPRAESDEESATVLPRGYLTTISRVTCGVHLATLRHFDTKVRGMVKTGPLIPWQRRLADMEISEFQEATFGTRFGYRDYDRPFTTFSVTLCCFD